MLFSFFVTPRLYSGQILPESYLVCPRHQITRFLPAEQLRFIAIRFKKGSSRLPGEGGLDFQEKVF